MITNTGKGILAKYLVGQAPAYASYIALGCGAKPLDDVESFDNEAYAVKQSLDFEMFRVPIISRGYVVEDVAVGNDVVQVSKVVLTAELPTEERYEISEIGIFSAANNPAAGANDSKVVHSFKETELWEYHTVTPAIAKAIPYIPQPLDSGNDNIITGEYLLPNATETLVLTDTPVFQTNADNRIFTEPNRLQRYEKCRFLNNMILMRGNTSELYTTRVDNVQRLRVVGGEQNHIHLTGTSLNFDQNSPTDEIRLAFSLINVSGNGYPGQVRVLFEFSSGDVYNTGEWARFEAILSPDTSNPLFANRYIVSSKQLQQLEKSASFTWTSVNVTKVYVSVLENVSVVSNKVATSTAVTLTTSTNHSFNVGDRVLVGELGDRFDGAFTILSTTANTFTYLNAGSVVASTVVSTTTPATLVKVGSPSDAYYVALDALRLENVSSENAVYGMTGYTVTVTEDGSTITKLANTKNYVEFRFGVDVA